MLPMNINYILRLCSFVPCRVVKKQIHNRTQHMNIAGVQTCLGGTLASISMKFFLICIYEDQLVATKLIHEFTCIKSPF